MTLLQWRALACPPSHWTHPAELPGDAGWLPSTMPATAASVLLAAGLPVGNLDDDDWWWQAALPPDLPSGSLLVSPGIATLAEIWVDSELAHRTHGMFEGFTLPLPSSATTLSIRVLSLNEALTEKRPRPRWKARLVAEQRLRWFRTSLTGRMPGLLDGHPSVGPWRGIDLVPGDRPGVVSPGVSAALLSDGRGVVTVRARVAGLAGSGGAVVTVAGQRVPASVISDPSGVAAVSASVTLDAPPLWWPHTHGEPALLPVSLELGSVSLPLGRTGFRSVAADLGDDGFALDVNGRRVFARGACWSPLADDGTHLSAETARETLSLLAGAGLNMVRLQGTTAWAAPEFLAVCDELGIMVWQDLPMAAMDQPDDPAFAAQVSAEVSAALSAAAGSPSLMVICGGAEIEQQAAMIGLPLDLEPVPLLRELLPRLVAGAPAELVCVANSPTGGVPAFRVDRGVAQYFGVGAYRRPLEDIRRADVRFAAECFAFAVPPHEELSQLLTDEAWAAGIPRDRGADWDFADVTGHFARSFYGEGVCATAGRAFLRDLHSAAAAECLTALLSEWRRPASSCAGALMISLRDVVAGPGWGLIDSAGAPKATWYAARRAAAPLALLHTDEGLNGLALHVVSDLPEPFEGTLRLDLYSGERVIESGSVEVALPPFGGRTFGDGELLGVFRDVTQAYRFGPPAFDLAVGVLLDAGGREVGRTVYLPLGRALTPDPDLGLGAELVECEGAWLAVVQARGFARGVVVSVDGGTVEDAWFDLLPGETRQLAVTGSPSGVRIRALNALR